MVSLNKCSLDCCKTLINFQSSEKVDFDNFRQFWQFSLRVWRGFLEILTLPFCQCHSESLHFKPYISIWWIKINWILKVSDPKGCLLRPASVFKFIVSDGPNVEWNKGPTKRVRPSVSLWVGLQGWEQCNCVSWRDGRVPAEQAAACSTLGRPRISKFLWQLFRTLGCYGDSWLYVRTLFHIITFVEFPVQIGWGYCLAAAGCVSWPLLFPGDGVWSLLLGWQESRYSCPYGRWRSWGQSRARLFQLPLTCL